MWHYQIFRTTILYTDEQRAMFDIQETEYYTYSIKEYYPNFGGCDNKATWTVEAMTPYGSSKEELIKDLENMLADAKTMGVRDNETGELVDE